MNSQIELRRWAVEQVIASGITGFPEIEEAADKLMTYVLGQDPDQLTEQLVEAVLRFTFRNQLRPQSEADEKLSVIVRIAHKIQKQRNADKQREKGI